MADNTTASRSSNPAAHPARASGTRPAGSPGMPINLGDDGSLDTVLVCDECGAEMRYNYDDTDHSGNPDAYEEFVDWAIADASDQHSCQDADA